MRTSGWQLCLLAASTLSAIALADFQVTSDRTTKLDGSAEHTNYVKSWTLTSKRSTQIESLDLSLAGTVYVSYSSDIPADVVGYVNVSGNSKTVVEGVTVSNEVNGLLPDVTSLDDVFGNTKKQLSVSLSHDIDEGYLLTEIFLSTHRSVNKVASRRTSNVVIEEDVLMLDSPSHGQKISATGLSTVYVSTPNSAIKVRQLDLVATGGAKIQYRSKNIFLWQKLELEASGDTNIKLVCPVVVAGKLELEAETKDSEICMSADEVESAVPEITGKDYISLPNANHKYGTLGESTCTKSKEPPREVAQFVPVPGGQQQIVNDAEANAVDADESGSRDSVKDDVVEDADASANDDTQSNVFNDTKNALYDAKDDLVNGTMNAIDNVKDNVIGQAKKSLNDATGNIFGGGSKVFGF